MEWLRITVGILVIAVAIVFGGFIVQYFNRQKTKQYLWYNPETGWLNRTNFVEPPQIGKIFWADEGFWEIRRVDRHQHQIEVSYVEP